jgi:hypothetical protein
MTSEQAKAAADLMTTVWEFEFPATCQVLAAVKDDNRSYTPDAKSRTAWELATHLAVDDIVAFYTKTFPEKMKALRALPGDKLTPAISFFGNFTWPAVQYIGFANNHSMHHRGQLAAYLRAMGSKVPNIYGPSADAKE